VKAARPRLEPRDELHGPDLGSTTDRARGKRSRQGFPRGPAFLEPAFDLADQMHHVRVPADAHENVHLHRARRADPAEVVAAQIDEHEMLGPFLGALQERALETKIALAVRAARAGTRDGAIER